jgi:PAS domain S-box-containing protein
MIERIRTRLAPPVFEDEEKTRIAGLLNTILLSVMAFALIYGFIALFLYDNPVPLLASVGVVVVLWSVALVLIRRGHVRPAALLFLSVLWVIVTFVAIAYGGVGASATGTYLTVAFAAGLLLGTRAGFGFAGISLLASLGMLCAEATGVLGAPLVDATPLAMWAGLATNLVWVVLLLHLTIGNLVQALGRARHNERALAESNRELATEIAERRRAEGELRNLSRAIEQSPSTVVITDTEGKVEYANPRFTQLTGYSLEEILGQNPRILKSGQHTPGFYQELWDTISAGGEWRSEFANRKKNGEIYWELASISPVRDAQGKVAHFVKVAEDITERKRAEEALRQRTAELEARNEELDAFSHTVAHDLQNPLGVVIGFAEVLEQDFATVPAEDLKRYLHLIAQRGRKMSNIIDELLLLAGVRQTDVEAVPLDMASIVAEAQRRLSDLIEEYQAEILVPEAWPAAWGHGPWVEEIWANYISNAVKHGGRPPRVELGAEVQADHMVRFWIRDNGPGLTLEEQARLFVPFTQLAQIRFEGHGLGLSIVRRIVEKLGGQVGVESKGVPGQGSIFFFTLPGMDQVPPMGRRA